MAVSSTFVSTDGDGYELQMGRWSRRLAPLFIDFSGIAEAATVLDVGCGTGSLTFAVAGHPNRRDIHGIDFSPVYVEYARRRNTDPRITFQTGDACALPFPDSSFDGALAMLVLQFIPRANDAIAEMRRVTKPGGIVAAATWDARGGFVSFRLFFDTAAVALPGGNERRAKVYTRPLSRPGELARAWQDAGLTSITEAMLTIRMDFASFADYWAPCEGKDGPIAEYVGTLDPSAKSTLRDHVMRAYLDGEPDGPRSYAATAWAIKGTVPS